MWDTCLYDTEEVTPGQLSRRFKQKLSESQTGFLFCSQRTSPCHWGYLSTDQMTTGQDMVEKSQASGGFGVM